MRLSIPIALSWMLSPKHPSVPSAMFWSELRAALARQETGVRIDHVQVTSFGARISDRTTGGLKITAGGSDLTVGWFRLPMLHALGVVPLEVPEYLLARAGGETPVSIEAAFGKRGTVHVVVGVMVHFDRAEAVDHVLLALADAMADAITVLTDGGPERPLRVDALVVTKNHYLARRRAPQKGA